MEQLDNVQKREKRLAHVDVYDQLHIMLTDNTFPVGSKLPPESKLAKMFGVSRVTLRKALDLLHDDGLLQKVQGAGNFVLDKSEAKVSSLDKMGHPVFKCSKIAIEEVEIEIKIEPSTEHQRELVKRDDPVMISLDIWYRNKGELIAYTFGTLPVDTVSKYQVDLNDKEQIQELVLNKIYEEAERTYLKLYPNSAGQSILADYIDTKGPVCMVMEHIYGEDYRPLMCNKHYLAIEDVSLEINVSK